MPKVKPTPPIHDTLTGYDFEVDPPLRPLKAIRMKCMECCCGSRAAVRDCLITDCSLWPYRLGRRPSTDKPVSAETMHVRGEFSTNEAERE